LANLIYTVFWILPNQRFTGQHAFVQSSEVRWNFLNVKTALIPVSLGVFAAFDYGRVWVDDDRVILPDSNENRWHSTPGIGLFVDMAEMLTANFSAFDSDEGLRLAFRLGFQF
jgi:hemolysin activation/secretion protein